MYSSIHCGGYRTAPLLWSAFGVKIWAVATCKLVPPLPPQSATHVVDVVAPVWTTRYGIGSAYRIFCILRVRILFVTKIPFRRAHRGARAAYTTTFRSGLR
jgi:hypothetical protein